jgi:hypothetical protein
MSCWSLVPFHPGRVYSESNESGRRSDHRITCAYYCRSHFSLGNATRENSQDRAMILKSWRRASHCARHEWRSDSADYADVLIDRYLPETIGCTPVDEGHRSERRMFPVHSGRWFAIRKSQQNPIQDGHVPWGARISSARQMSTRANLFTVPDTICKIRERNRRCVFVTQIPVSCIRQELGRLPRANATLPSLSCGKLTIEG